jgi:hypothetical protein
MGNKTVMACFEIILAFALMTEENHYKSLVRIDGVPDEIQTGKRQNTRK